MSIPYTITPHSCRRRRPFGGLPMAAHSLPSTHWGEISVHSDYGSALQTTCTCSRRLALLCFFLPGEFACGLEPNAGRPSRPSRILTRLFYCIATKHSASGHHSSPATTPTSRDGPSSFSTLFCIFSQTRSGTSKPQSTIINAVIRFEHACAQPHLHPPARISHLNLTCFAVVLLRAC